MLSSVVSIMLVLVLVIVSNIYLVVSNLARSEIRNASVISEMDNK